MKVKDARRLQEEKVLQTELEEISNQWEAQQRGQSRLPQLGKLAFRCSLRAFLALAFELYWPCLCFMYSYIEEEKLCVENLNAFPSLSKLIECGQWIPIHWRHCTCSSGQRKYFRNFNITWQEICLNENVASTQWYKKYAVFLD